MREGGKELEGRETWRRREKGQDRQKREKSRYKRDRIEQEDREWRHKSTQDATKESQREKQGRECTVCRRRCQTGPHPALGS